MHCPRGCGCVRPERISGSPGSACSGGKSRRRVQGCRRNRSRRCGSAQSRLRGERRRSGGIGRRGRRRGWRSRSTWHEQQRGLFCGVQQRPGARREGGHPVSHRRRDRRRGDGLGDVLGLRVAAFGRGDGRQWPRPARAVGEVVWRPPARPRRAAGGGGGAGGCGGAGGGPGTGGGSSIANPALRFGVLTLNTCVLTTANAGGGGNGAPGQAGQPGGGGGAGYNVDDCSGGGGGNGSQGGPGGGGAGGVSAGVVWTGTAPTISGGTQTPGAAGAAGQNGDGTTTAKAGTAGGVVQFQ